MNKKQSASILLIRRLSSELNELLIASVKNPLKNICARNKVRYFKDSFLVLWEFFFSNTQTLFNEKLKIPESALAIAVAEKNVVSCIR